ncbi:hypothetical protein GOP47_0016869 [Adiantum capillus-veneris]|uniref:Uncharacterized protein n=1 Tax=Adiantum capillus-veneris TaxID=13818 RepID=A0A9D4UII2_ADICA|nr:hypothetical protein GOP47_0016869 [Adiantum capillus-veneris]
MGGNWAIATCVFCGFQELTREIRAADPDDWANCFLGGLASGALLGRIQGGPARALPMAVLFAFVGTGINHGADLFKEYRLQRLLASLPSEDALPPAPSAERGFKAERESKRSAWLDFELPEWFPIKKLDEEEAKRRYLERENQRYQRLESLQTGTFPAKDQ